MFLCLLEAAAAIAFVLAIVWFVILMLSDADVALTLKTKFGKQPDHLAGKVVWITGAASGIGECHVYRLAECGCRLVLTDRNEEGLDRVKAAVLEKCKAKEEDILILPFDVCDFDSHQQKVEEVLKYFTKIDILINNAGRTQRAAWQDVELSVDRDLMDVNVFAPVSLTQAVLPHMMQRKQGHIVVVSSLAGKMGAPLSRSYTGSKHAVQGFFDCLRTEVADHNISVTLICPGPTHSNLFMDAAMAKFGEKLGKPMDLSEKRLPTERAAYLSCVAIANRQYEAWMSLHPILWLQYCNQYLPDLFKWYMETVGVKKFMSMREGKKVD